MPSNINTVAVAAGIVLFSPDLPLLRSNIEAIAPQVTTVFLFDNGSRNLPEVEGLLRELRDSLRARLVLHANGRNVGIASALNELCAMASCAGYPWLVTLDQDSVCPPSMVADYVRYVGEPKIGQLCPNLFDATLGARLRTVQSSDEEFCGLADVRTCITSGALTNLEGWRDVGGFDEAMFIDEVDNEYSLRLRSRGWRVACVGEVTLSHALGQMEAHRLFGREYHILNHSAFRKYYMARNKVYVARKRHGSVVRAVLSNLMMCGAIILYEHPKGPKLWATLKGTTHGFGMKLKSRDYARERLEGRGRRPDAATT